MKILGNDDVVANRKQTANKPSEQIQKEVDLEVGEMLNVNFDKQFNEINNDSDGLVIEDNRVINEGLYKENKLSDL